MGFWKDVSYEMSLRKSKKGYTRHNRLLSKI